MPPRTIISEFTTIGRIFSISGNSLIELTSLKNLSSLISLGLLGFDLISDILADIVFILPNLSQNRLKIKSAYRLKKNFENIFGRILFFKIKN